MSITATATYWTKRILTLFPKAWGADTSFKYGGVFHNFTYETVGNTLSYVAGQINYTQLQTRIATATDTNLEAIANDFFGNGVFPRLLLLDASGLNLVLETDAAYSLRIRQNIFALKNTQAALQLVASAYVTTQYISDTILNTLLFGLDTAGGLDTRGGLDGITSNIPQIPQVLVFDRQDNPRLAAKVPLSPGQFCVLFSYGGLTQSGFFVGRAHLNRSDFLLNTNIQIVPPLTSGLSTIINNTKATGTTPVYADNRVG